MALSKQDLLDLKEDVEEAKTKVAELTGQQNALMKQLKDNFGCNTIEEAETKMEEIEKSIKKLDKKIEEGSAELEKQLNEIEEEEEND